MRVSSKARMNRLVANGGCLDVAIDHGVCNEPSFLSGLEDMAGVVDALVDARPDAIQMAYGQADLLQSRPGKDKPALVMRIDMGNPYNAQRHKVMWSMLQNHDEPIIGALEMDAACVVVNLFMLPDEPELFRQCVDNAGHVFEAGEEAWLVADAVVDGDVEAAAIGEESVHSGLAAHAHGWFLSSVRSASISAVTP